MRVALVHDWLVGMRGGEKCLEEFVRIFPESEVFTLFHEPGKVSQVIEERPITTSFLNPLRRCHRYLLPLYELGMRGLSSKLAKRHREAPFELVISISHCAAKSARLPVPHLCYCLTPPRYIWDQFESYFSSSPLRPVISLLRPLLQRADLDGSRSPDRYLAISDFVRERIFGVYGKTSAVIYPPVDTEFYSPGGGERRGFLVVNALVPYKNTDLIIEAFNRSGEQLTIVGSGPEEGRLRALAKPNITFKNGLSEEELRQEYRSARALIFGAEEDFGITPVEAQGCGTPVIALKKGGARETVSSGVTGVFFSEATVASILSGFEEFLRLEERLFPDSCRRNAERFSRSRFMDEIRKELKSFIEREPEEQRKRAHA